MYAAYETIHSWAEHVVRLGLCFGSGSIDRILRAMLSSFIRRFVVCIETRTVRCADYCAIHFSNTHTHTQFTRLIFQVLIKSKWFYTELIAATPEQHTYIIFRNGFRKYIFNEFSIKVNHRRTALIQHKHTHTHIHILITQLCRKNKFLRAY